VTKKKQPPAPTPKIVYGLRTCNADMSAYNGFVWPESGMINAPDWKATTNCGNGLHALLWGAGDYSHLSTKADAKWLVVAIDEATLIDLDGKVKFPRCEVVFCGTRFDAVADIVARGADVQKCNYATLTGGDRATLTGGDYATLTGGDGATLTGGDGATLVFKWWDSKSSRLRLSVGEVGENGIDKDKPYFVRNGVIVEKK